jgi:hypothetical protein
MKTADDISYALADLQPEFDALENAQLAYFDVCQKLHDEGQTYTRATVNLNATLEGKGESSHTDAVTAVGCGIAKRIGTTMLPMSGMDCRRILSQCNYFIRQRRRRQLRRWVPERRPLGRRQKTRWTRSSQRRKRNWPCMNKSASNGWLTHSEA